jgi:uncharacterized sodium:solute symporter family permease YidK
VLAALVSVLLTGVAIAPVPRYQSATSIINLFQQVNGLLSMPILPAFVAGLLFRRVAASASAPPLAGTRRRPPDALLRALPHAGDLQI